MNVNFYLKSIEEKEKFFLEDYLKEKIKRLEKLCAGRAIDQFKLDVKAEQFAKKSAYQVEFIFTLAGKSFTASEDDHTIREALDMAFDKLIKQVRIYIGKEKDQKK